MQQIFLGLGAVATKTYVDDIFSTYVYTGNGSARSINNGIDLSGEGGMVWIKKRNSATGGNSHIADTARGITKYLTSNENYAELTDANRTSATTSQGFSLGTASTVNNNNDTYASWSFRKAPGFCDVVTYTGNGSNRTIAHSLGSVPGFILVKRLDDSKNWIAYHKALGAANYLILNSNGSEGSGSSLWHTEPTASVFSVGTSVHVNASSGTYVAYVFAGGESTAATARSVDFDGTGDYLSLGASSDLQLGTGDFTVEGWFKYDYVSDTPAIFDFRSTTGSVTDGFAAFVQASTSKLALYSAGGWIITATNALGKNQWNHFAVVKSSGTIKLYINGTQSGSSYTTSTNFTNNTLKIGSGATGANRMYGWISNFRVVKGTAVYTSSFRPPTEPLTNITNTKLLCCNDSSTTGSTVTPGTITANGDPTASTDSPFDDPAGFVFGESGSESVIKMGTYLGNGANNGAVIDGPKVDLGWEPSWVLIKGSSVAEKWTLFDQMRPNNSGFLSYLAPSETDAEGSSNFLELNSKGFQIKLGHDQVNANNQTYIYVAIRRPDGYVGKPPELGTGVFAMDTGNGSSTIPNYDSGFPVDIAIDKIFASTAQWYLSGRLTGTNYLRPDDTNSELSQTNYKWDSNVGWGNGSWQNQYYQSWMFKRHAGFDVVTYNGTGSARAINHSLKKVPEMIWVKRRDSTRTWGVYHFGQNGGTNPEQYAMYLDTTQIANTSSQWNNTAPTSTHFSLGTSSTSNNSSGTYIAMLFSSVDGISKFGYYTGTGSTGLSVNVGFQPRFILFRGSDMGGPWRVLDSVRGMSSGNDKSLSLNTTAAQVTNFDWLDVTSTGFTINTTDGEANASGKNYIYYCHA